MTYFKALPREKTAIIKLRNKGYSINHLSAALGRSTSWIHRILKEGRLMGLVHIKDNRKLPRRTLLISCRKRLKTCLLLIKQWEPFILGEEGEPP